MNSNESGWFVAAIAIFMLVVVIVVNSGGSYVAPAHHQASAKRTAVFTEHMFVPSPAQPRPFGHAFDSGLTFGKSKNCRGR